MAHADMLAFARSLEDGRFGGAVARLLSSAWGRVAARAVVRAVALPGGTRVVAVGGATLGGSGKTPLAVACARELASRGARVAFVGHAYRARPRHARVVRPQDALSEVGDEALVVAGALELAGIPVVVAPSRADAVALAARLADVLVLDGVLQTAPARAALSLLAVDADEPWGRAGAVPPRGDLRAPVDALLASADAVVSVGDGTADARVVSDGARVADVLVSWEELARLRVGLACALGRPSRLLRFLARRGVVPIALARARDHGSIPPSALRGAVDVWLATPKCALHAPALHVRSAPLGTIDHDVVLSPALCARIAGIGAP